MFKNSEKIDIKHSIESLNYLRKIHPFYNDKQFCAHVGISVEEYYKVMNNNIDPNNKEITTVDVSNSNECNSCECNSCECNSCECNSCECNPDVDSNLKNTKWYSDKLKHHREKHSFLTDEGFCAHVGITLEQYNGIINSNDIYELNISDDCCSDKSDSEDYISNESNSQDDNNPDDNNPEHNNNPEGLMYLRDIHPFYTDEQFCAHVGITIEQYKDIVKNYKNKLNDNIHNTKI